MLTPPPPFLSATLVSTLSALSHSERYELLIGLAFQPEPRTAPSTIKTAAMGAPTWIQTRGTPASIATTLTNIVLHRELLCFINFCANVAPRAAPTVAPSRVARTMDSHHAVSAWSRLVSYRLGSQKTRVTSPQPTKPKNAPPINNPTTLPAILCQSVEVLYILTPC